MIYRIQQPKRSGGLENLASSRQMIARTTKGIGTSPDEGGNDLGVAGPMGLINLLIDGFTAICKFIDFEHAEAYDLEY